MFDVKKIDLIDANLDDLAKLLQENLKDQFKTCSVSIVDCPDLTKNPFDLSAPGLCGNTAIVDIGGIPYLTPLANRTKIYTFEQVANIVNIGNQDTFIIGAGAGPFHKIGHNCELMPNVLLRKENQNGQFKIIKDNTHYAEINASNGYTLAKSSSGEFGILGDLFVSEGKPGKVLKIEASQRIGKNNFITMLREIVQKLDKRISLGGVFLIETGKAHLHIMPDFSKVPLNTDKEVDNWLRFFEMDSPLVCLSVFHSFHLDANLRSEHTHCFSDHNQGGHYHYDTTPDDVKYVAYLNVAKHMYRIDKPPL